MIATMTKKAVLLIIFSVFAGAIVVGITAWGANAWLTNESKPKQPDAVACTTLGENHRVIIKNDAASQTLITGRLCDTLTITNEDPTFRVMAFGPHEDHQSYNGITEKLLEQGQSLTVVMDKIGTYHFHDHIHDEVAGDFTVL